MPVEVHYFEVKQVEGSIRMKTNDEDVLDVAWKKVDEFDQLRFSFPPDKDFLTQFIQKRALKGEEKVG